MRRALLDMRPDRFEDIIALVALYRPGPMANIPTYCARKHGMEQPDYIHPKLEPILRETYGVIIYQEQVMQAAQILAGYSLGEADLLRRAMGKKIRKEMQAQRERLRPGAIERGIERAQADAIFDLLERFADYGFNKSHAAAYALVAYQTAYLKANYPVEFLAASMTLDMGNTDKLAEFRAEAERLGIKVEPPSVNRSGVDVRGRGQHASIYALAALKGVGAPGGRSDRRGARRAAVRRPRRLRRAASIRARSTSACWKASPPPAPSMRSSRTARASFAGVDAMLARAQRAHEAAAVGQNELFGGAAQPRADRAAGGRALAAGRAAAARIRGGRLLPVRPSARRLRRACCKKLRVQSWAEFCARGESRRDRRPRRRHRGRRAPSGAPRPATRWASSACPIRPGITRRSCSPKGLPQYRDLLEPGTAVLLFLSARSAGRRGARAHPVGRAARCRRRQAAAKACACSCATTDAARSRRQAAASRRRARAARATARSAWCCCLRGGAEVEVKLPGRFKVSPQIAGAIKAVPGVVQVEAV